jgi:hypothetical protein
MVDREPGRNLVPMGLNPVGILGGGLLRIIRQAFPLDEPWKVEDRGEKPAIAA